MRRNFYLQPEMPPDIDSWLNSPGDLDDFLFYPEKDFVAESQK